MGLKKWDPSIYGKTEEHFYSFKAGDALFIFNF